MCLKTDNQVGEVVSRGGGGIAMAGGRGIGSTVSFRLPQPSLTKVFWLQPPYSAAIKV